MSALRAFTELLQSNRAGKKLGIYSVCSSHDTVLRAAMARAVKDDTVVLVESTSNQVDQYGGYTGMTPATFVSYVHSIAASVGLSADRVLLGGDHLGPNVWQGEPSSIAMEKAKTLVEEYVKAGYQKIHLDASMPLADDVVEKHKPLADEIVAERASALCEVAEAAWRRYRGGSAAPVYVIGTEVPVPGGAKEKEDHVIPTSPADALKTIEVTKASFEARGLHEAWSRVVGAVVQPGVEFGDDQVFDYEPYQASELSKVILTVPTLVFEAHSTDYQTEEGLGHLVRDHFCILKVGPWLTFAYREAMFALEQIEIELLGCNSPDRSNLRTTLDAVMVENPKYWQKYYPGDESQKKFKRSFSFSDRSRYYWPSSAVAAAVGRLLSNLSSRSIPLSLLSQYTPYQYESVANGLIEANPVHIAALGVDRVLGKYARACGLSGA
jgi:D-tagatose-1,6-bisphosphate aldolase subunit GatZ/KbaZ